jgi:hypothetical protein
MGELPMTMTFMNWLRLGRNAGVKLLATGLITGMVLLVAHAAEQQGSIALRKDSPQSYTVKEGDTLWDIAARFLEKPWLWPQVWQINPQIQNPDLIYPGDLISLSYQDGKPVLSLNRDTGAAQSTQSSQSKASSGVIAASAPPEVPEVAGLRTEHRSPEARRQPISSPIPAIPLNKVFAFLSKNNIVDAESFDKAPYLLAEQQGRRLYSTGNDVFARGNWSTNITTYDIVREGRKFKNPDTKKLLGVESIMIGTATITSFNGDRAVMKIDSALQEARPGDRLIPRQKLAIDDSYMPSPPAFDVDAAIASIADGRNLGGLYDSLVLNQGSANGLQAGHVLTIKEPSIIVKDDIGKTGIFQSVRQFMGLKGGRKVEYPGENIATVLIYRVYDHASLALVLSSKHEIKITDRAVTP